MTVSMTPKGEAIVETGRKLFFRHGIKRVSVEEVCREAEVSKMTFYRSFKNKDDLVHHILDQLVDASIAHCELVMKKKAPFSEKMEVLMSMKVKMVEQFSKEFMKDLMSSSGKAGLYLLKRRQEADAMMKTFFREAQKKGELRSDLNIDFMLHFTECFRQFMRDETLQGLYPDSATLMKEISNFYLYGVLGRKGKRK